MRSASLWLVASLALAACGGGEGVPLPALVEDDLGGLANRTFAPTGFFRVERAVDRDFLVTPAGHAFLSTGVTSVGPEGSYAPNEGVYPYRTAVDRLYADEGGWADATAQRLRAWRFNTLGSWSNVEVMGERLPYTVILNLADADWLAGTVADYFDPAWEAFVAARVEAEVVPRADDPLLIGYFTDNELRWSRDWRDFNAELLEDYLALPATAPGKIAAVEFFAERYGQDIGAFNGPYRTSLGSFAELLDLAAIPSAYAADAAVVLADARAFLERVARRYFETTSTAIRAADPNHLILGCRMISVLTPLEVASAAAGFVDVLSVNNYVFLPGMFELTQELFSGLVDPGTTLESFAALGGAPVLISEFGFRAADSGLPNTYPPIYPVFETQADRAAAFEEYTRDVLAAPHVVGLHWFTWVDQPASGRFDGENNNWGLVSIDDVPYERVTQRMRAVYGEWFARSVGAAPPASE